MFGENLKKLRKENKITQMQLANHLGFFHSAIVKWEKGICEPTFDTLIKIAKYFNVTVDYLLGTTDSIFTAEDYAQGVRMTKQVQITADDENVLDKYHEVEELLNGHGKNLIIDFCNVLIENFKK